MELGMSQDYVERFDQVPLFEGLERMEIAELLRITEDIPAHEGDFIVLQGSPGDGFYVIGAGKFEVLKAKNREKVLARLEQLSSFGEMSLVTDDVRSATVLCVEEGRLKRFPKARFQELLDAGNIPAYKVVRNMCRLLARRLAAVDDRLVE
jgi:CRP-like cAMP-binding protein